MTGYLAGVGIGIFLAVGVCLGVALASRVRTPGRPSS